MLTPEADALAWALALVVASERVETATKGRIGWERPEREALDELRRVRVELDRALRRLVPRAG